MAVLGEVLRQIAATKAPTGRRTPNLGATHVRQGVVLAVRIVRISDRLVKPAMPLQSAILLVATAVCAYTDARWGKVYNAVTYPCVLLGIGLSFYSAPPTPAMSVLGLLAGLLFFAFVRKISGMGAGDVKLMAALGALKGLPFLVYGTFYILCAATVTGLVLIAWQGRLVPVLKWVAQTLAATVNPRASRNNLNHEMTPMPFAPAIFIGAAFSVYLEMVHGPFTF